MALEMDSGGSGAWAGWDTMNDQYWYSMSDSAGPLIQGSANVNSEQLTINVFVHNFARI
jgi:hypothetical protein